MPNRKSKSRTKRRRVRITRSHVRQAQWWVNLGSMLAMLWPAARPAAKWVRRANRPYPSW